ncbi:TMEM131 family protein [Megaselia abdita]
MRSIFLTVLLLLVPGRSQLVEVSMQPSILHFGEINIGTARSQIVTIINHKSNASVQLNSIGGETTSFYSSFFQEKTLPPQSNTTFNVIFLPRQNGKLQTSLFINTSLGGFYLSVSGEAKECPYMLKPLVGVKSTLNSTLRPEIFMYNPHANPITILEVYSSGGQFQLELPSGTNEGPKNLWEIPAYALKPIIRIKFHGNTPGHHSAYIRIKISGFDPGDPSLEDVLIVPVEFQILQEYGLYTESPILNFGRILRDELKVMKLNFTNSEDSSGGFSSFRFENISKHIIRLLDDNRTIELNASNLKGDIGSGIDLNGKLIFNISKDEEIVLRIHGRILSGSFTYDKKALVFMTKAKNYTSNLRQFDLNHSFDIPISVLDLKIDNNRSDIFKIFDFEPKILQPHDGTTTNIFKIQPENDLPGDINFETTIQIVTNVTIIEISLVICSGLLKVYTSFDLKSYKGDTKGGGSVINMDYLTFGEHSRKVYVVFENVNSVPLSMGKWSIRPPNDVTYEARLVGCKRQEDEKHMMFCSQLEKGDSVAYEVSMRSYSLEDEMQSAIFDLSTDVKSATAVIKFVTVFGKLSVFNDTASSTGSLFDLDEPGEIVFNNCFPGKLCAANLKLKSTFLQEIEVTSITLDIPGVVINHPLLQVRHSNPRIPPKSLTDWGKIYFQPAVLCESNCYLPLEEDDEELTLSEFSLLQRIEMFKQLSLVLTGMRLLLNTTHNRVFEFPTTVNLIWPKLHKTGLKSLPSIELNNHHTEKLTFHNPSPYPVVVRMKLSNPDFAKSISLNLPSQVIDSCKHCYLTDKHVFSLDGESRHVIAPNGGKLFVRIKFKSSEVGVFSTVLHLKNNLTLHEAIWLTAKSVQPRFSFGNRRPGCLTPLLFEIKENNAYQCNKPMTVKRSFSARNTGEVPVHLKSVKIDGQCEGYGFKILNCDEPFVLKTNLSKRIDIEFTPDFTLTRVNQMVTVNTNLSYPINYTLTATIPQAYISKCYSQLERPVLEDTLRYTLVAMLAVTLFFVFIVSFLDTDKILKEHIESMSKEKGPIQPALDLRNIALKSMDFSMSTMNSNTENTQKPRRRFKNPPPLPIPAWADALSKKMQPESTKQQKSQSPEAPSERSLTPTSSPSTPKAPPLQKKKKEDKEASKEKEKKKPKQKQNQTPPTAKKLESENVTRTPTPKSQSQSPVPSKMLPDLLNHPKHLSVNPPKKNGKTPGRERKIKEHNHTNPFPQPTFEPSSSVPPSPNDDVAEYKSNAFQFSSPLEMDDVHVISSNLDPWNLDLTGYKENKDLGPIGSRKTPSSMNENWEVLKPLASFPHEINQNLENTEVVQQTENGGYSQSETVSLDEYNRMVAMLKLQHEIIQRQNIEWSRTQQAVQNEQILAAIRNQTMSNTWNTLPASNTLPMPSVPVNNLALQAPPVNTVAPMIINGNLNSNRVPPPPPGLEHHVNRPVAQNPFNDGSPSSSALNPEQFDLSSIWSADWTPNNRQ